MNDPQLSPHSRSFPSSAGLGLLSNLAWNLSGSCSPLSPGRGWG